MSVPALGPSPADPPPARPADAAQAVQLAFDELDTPLRDTTFVVVDLETTGGSADQDAITEIGAVKVRGGEVLGEFATLVDPGRSIPPQITSLTGITHAMVSDAPRIGSVLPSFLEFAAGTVLVAHNARFDVGFLRAAAARHDTAWPAFPVLCTVTLARRVLPRSEVPSVRLSSLASLFGTSTTPTHRALDDARATVDVLHALIERVGNQGVHSLTELRDYAPAVTRAQRAKRSMASSLPRAPGVYLFRGPSDEVLYVGTAVDLRRRVRGYFTGSDTRPRMREMVALATRVDHVRCAHALEASVRELRLIAAHTPPYNRRSKYPMRGWWVAPTDEPFPRLTVRRTPAPDAIGPFSRRADAAEVADTLARACRLRTCTHRVRAGTRHGDRCAPEAVGGCAAAHNGPEDAATYAVHVDDYLATVRGTDDRVLVALRARLDDLAAAELFENAARARDRLVTLVKALRRTQRLAALAALSEIVVARRRDGGGWEFGVIRYGRLAAAGVSERGAPPMPVVDAIAATAETVVPGDGPLRGASVEEAGVVARWIGAADARIVRTAESWSEPARGARAWAVWADGVAAAARAATGAH